MNEEILLKSFIGEKYDKIKNKKFSIPAFLFGGLYYAYRKLYILGFILYILTALITTLLPSNANNILLKIFLYIVLSTACGICFKPIYMLFSKYKITKIQKQNLQNPEDLLKDCKRKGKTSFIAVIVVIILYAICINFIMSKSNTKTHTSNKYNLETETSKELSIDSNKELSRVTPKENGEYSGVLSVNSNVNLNEILKIQIPTIFKKTFLNSTYLYDFKYDTESDGIFDECNISLNVVNDYSDSTQLINEMSKYHSATQTLKTEKINNIEWTSYEDISSIATTYYSATTNNGLVYLLEYSIQRDVKGNKTDYIKYYTDILNSITFIN